MSKLVAIDGGRARQGARRAAPHNLEAEASVLGAMLVDPRAVAIVTPLLNPIDFYKPAHATICAAIYDVAEHGRADAVAVADHLERNGWLDDTGGRSYLVELMSAACAQSVAGQHAEIVARHAQARRIRVIADGLIEAVADGTDPAVIAGKLKDDVDALIGVTNRRNRLFNAADLIRDHLDVIAERADVTEPDAGIRTTWRAFDDLTGGLRAGQLIVIAGRPGMGKSAVAAGIALRVALTYGLRVLTVSIEMSLQELLDRYVAATARIDLTRVRAGIDPAEDPHAWAKAQAEADKFDDKNLWILDDPTATLPSIHSAAQRIEADLVIVDYLQIVETLAPAGAKNRTREREVAELSGGLKRMARDLNVPVIALSQFNRDLESRMSDKRPQLTDLRESGAIENDADLVVGLYRPEYYNAELPDGSPEKNLLEMIVLKQRNGPTGTARLFFEARTGRIGNATPRGRF